MLSICRPACACGPGALLLAFAAARPACRPHAAAVCWALSIACCGMAWAGRIDLGCLTDLQCNLHTHICAGPAGRMAAHGYM